MGHTPRPGKLLLEQGPDQLELVTFQPDVGLGSFLALRAHLVAMWKIAGSFSISGFLRRAEQFLCFAQFIWPITNSNGAKTPPGAQENHYIFKEGSEADVARSEVLLTSGMKAA